MAETEEGKAALGKHITHWHLDSPQKLHRGMKVSLMKLTGAEGVVMVAATHYQHEKENFQNGCEGLGSDIIYLEYGCKTFDHSNDDLSTLSYCLSSLPFAVVFVP
jgi:hypothetical protein